jgi:hypothetical protein
MAIKYSSIGGGSGTGFNVQIGSQYSYATFTQAQPAGAYTIKSSNNYTNWDVYLLDASNNLVAYTGSASIAPTTAFSAIVVVNGTLNDILQFSFQSTVFSTATTSQTKAGPFITAFGSSVIPSVNSAVTITGGNFAVGITATFTGTDSVVRTCKSVVYNSTTSISVVRPDSLPVAYAPYILTLTNPGVNNPATSGKNLLTGLTVGNAPAWSTATSLPAASGGTAYSTTLVATDVEGAVTYSYVSGTLPTGLSFNAGTGVISGTYSAFTDGTASYTVRATDLGNNFTDRTFTIAYTGLGGGTLTSDATYYYRVFTSNGTLQLPATLSVDVLQIAGGAGGGGGFGTDASGGGGGAGGVLYNAAYSIPVGNTTIVVGGGGAGGAGSSNSLGSNGIASTLTLPSATVLTAVGGGAGSTYPAAQPYPNDGGSGGGCGGAGGDGGSPSPQRGGFGTAGQGNNGGQHKGTGQSNGSTSAGGGGGAGAVGGDGTAGSTGGSGGAGTTSYSSWLTAITSVMTGVSGWSTATSGGYIAGGGGGGSVNGSAGGGGAGGGGVRGTPVGRNSSSAGGGATASTGGGGGGASAGNSTQPGGAGGSGLVVVRYTKASVGG